jgi:hypothetical protein
LTLRSGARWILGAGHRIGATAPCLRSGAQKGRDGEGRAAPRTSSASGMSGGNAAHMSGTHTRARFTGPLQSFRCAAVVLYTSACTMDHTATTDRPTDQSRADPHGRRCSGCSGMHLERIGGGSAPLRQRRLEQGKAASDECGARASDKAETPPRQRCTALRERRVLLPRTHAPIAPVDRSNRAKEAANCCWHGSAGTARQRGSACEGRGLVASTRGGRVRVRACAPVRVLRARLCAPVRTRLCACVWRRACMRVHARK